MKNIIKLFELREYIENENRSGDLDYAHYSVIIDYIFVLEEEIKKLKVFDDFITQCEYCTMYDFNSQICKQNGCKDMEDFKFFKEIV